MTHEGEDRVKHDGIHLLQPMAPDAERIYRQLRQSDSDSARQAARLISMQAAEIADLRIALLKAQRDLENAMTLLELSEDDAA
jgi:hypothetical protein